MDKSIKILLIEDNPGDARLIAELLKDAGGGFELTTIPRLDAAIEKLGVSQFDVVLLDLGLPDSAGIDTFLMARNSTPHTPMVILTGNDDVELASTAVRGGAQDYIVKGKISPELLARSIRYAIERHVVTSQLIEKSAALESSESRFRIVFERSTVGKVLLGLDGKPIQVNKSFADMVGYTVEELQRMDFIQLAHPDDVEKYNECIRSLLAGERSECRMEKRYIHKNGDVVWGDLSSTLLRDGDGAPMYFITSIVDITERKQAESRSQMANEVLSILNQRHNTTDTIRDILLLIKSHSGMQAVGIRLREENDYPYYATNGFSEDFVLAERFLCERDAEGKIVRDSTGNPALECMCGNILRSRFDPALPFFTTGGSFWSNNTTELLATTTEADRQARTRNRCNGEGYQSVALIPIRSGDEIIGLLQLNDKRPDRFTQDMIRFFEGLGASIGIALNRMRAEEALRQSQKMEAIGILAGGIAHDFNNMLFVISANAHLALAETGENSAVGDILRKIVSAVDKSKNLTAKLLTYAREEKLDVKPVAIDKLIEDVTFMLDKSFLKKINIEKSLRSGLPPVNADRNRLEQAILNICANARDAMPGGGTLTIHTENVFLDKEFCGSLVGVNPGSYCLIRIKDTGTGMSDEIIGRIFDPFFTTKEIGKGTGLGLSVTQGIIKGHGGHITANSRPGEGTEIEIYIPFADENAALEEKPPKKAVASGTETVLLVEDDEGVRELGAILLQRAGYSVITADSGEEAISIYKKRRKEIAVVLTDLLMPGLDGENVYDAVKEIEPGAKVIIVSGYGEPGKLMSLIAKGVNAVIEKPYNPPEIYSKIREVLDS